MGSIAGKAVLVTGANRGIGRALVEEALRRGAARVYAGTRQPMSDPEERVTPLRLEVTSPEQIQDAVEQVESLDILINNAGVAIYDDLSDIALFERHFEVNLYGPHRMIQAFLPLLTRSRGAIVNHLSVTAFAPLAVVPSYCVSKAAAFSMTQSLRVLLAERGVRVHAVMTGVVDTEMTREFEGIPKATPESVAQGILDGVANGDEEIFPDPLAEALAESWRGGAVKALERQFAEAARAALADAA